MLIITEEVMDALQNIAVDEFENRMLKHLKTIFPEQTKPTTDEKLIRSIRTGINNSKQYGLNMEWDIRRFLESSVLYGWEFGTSQETLWAHEILKNNDIDGRTKMDQIEQFNVTSEQDQNDA